MSSKVIYSKHSIIHGIGCHGNQGLVNSEVSLQNKNWNKNGIVILLKKIYYAI